MTTINDRIRELRKSQQLTQTAFGARIGLTKSAVVNMEIPGRAKIADVYVKAMCMAFGANEDWLRTGEGPMFTNTAPDDLDAVLLRYGLPSSLRGLFLCYTKLTYSAQQEVDKAITEWARELVQQKDELAQQPKEKAAADDEWTLEHIQAEIARHWESEKSAHTEAAASFFGESDTKTGTG